MSIVQVKDGTTMILKVNAESLEKEEAALFKETALQVLDSGYENIKIDFSKTNYIDSSGIGKLLFINKKVQKMNGKFEILNINKSLYDILDSLALTKVIEIVKPK